MKINNNSFHFTSCHVILCHVIIYIVVARLNGFNQPPAQVQPLSMEYLYFFAQKIVQLTQTFATQKLTNGNGTNFWDQFLGLVILIVIRNKVNVIVFM